MQSVPRFLPFLLLLLLPAAQAVEPEDAQALWNEAYGGDAVLEVSLGAPVVEGAPIQGHIRFNGSFPVTDVTYQVCEVGDVCFASGVPTELRDGAWAFDTADLTEAVGRTLPETYKAGERIGFQFFICQDAECDWATQTGTWIVFPEGLDESDPIYQSDFTAWSETHYFATTIQPGEKDTPAPGLLPILGLVVVALLLRRRP